MKVGHRSSLEVALAMVVVAGAGEAFAAAEASVPARVQFNRDVRPILSDKCFFCHGPDKGKRKAGLRLDDRAAAIADGALVPGKPAQSEVWRRVASADPDDVMPPLDAHKNLTKREREVLHAWIAQGAVYEPHWAYVPVVRPAIPATQASSPPVAGAAGVLRFARTPVDAFILQRLGEKNLTPSPEADPRTLLRRVSLDLTGLPPAPGEIRAFLAEIGAGAGLDRAYARAVDRLLASPHYGERMAVPWLDVVRFTDTVGYHGDQNQNIFPYRDYVISSFNQNKPFDRFVTEQLAGDLLPGAGAEALIATGFNRLNMVTREGGAQPKEYLTKYAADRVRTVGGAFLGTTTGCAECHDHKYDPFSTRDFYAMAAFFADIKQWGVYSDYGYTKNQELKGWSNDHPFPPELTVDSPYLRARSERLRAAISAHLARAAARLAQGSDAARFAAWQGTTAAFVKAHPDGWTSAVPRFVSTKNERVRLDGATAVLFSESEDRGPEDKVTGEKGPEDSRTLEVAPAPGWLTAIRLEVVARPEHQGSSFREGKEAALLKVSAKVLRADRRTESPLPFAFADADVKATRYDNGREILGVATGWKTVAGQHDRTQVALFQLARPIEFDAGDAIAVTVNGGLPAAIRVSTSPLPVFGLAAVSPRARRPGALPDLADIATRAFGRGGGPSARAAQAELFLLGPGLAAPEHDLTRKTFWALHEDLLETREGRSPTLITVPSTPVPVRVLPRGNWQDESGTPIEPATPHFLPKLPGAASPPGKRPTRLDLALWLTWRGNPLTARVFVNRMWRHLFGAGLSGQLGDLGAQGETPSHPELLDWLAAEFMDSGWDIKRLMRLLVTSGVYRQDSRGRPDLQEIDPQNRLLARQSPRRLDAEFVRDNALFVSGLLVRDIGGPSARPYQPAGYYENLQFPERNYLPHLDDRQWRRGLYMHWQRTFLHPMLANFDATAREECTADRMSSNTPQQALTLLNDPTFTEAARALAAALLHDRTAATDTARLERGYERVLGRPTKLAEREGLLRFLGEQRRHFAAQGDGPRKLVRIGVLPPATDLDPVEHAAWTSLARVLLNLHETITRY